MKPFIRSAHNYDRFVSSMMLATINELPDITVQSHRDEADINVLVKRYGVTGQMPQIQPPPSIDEFNEVFDFQSAMNVVRRSQESFNALPASLRERFNNDPAKFVDFCQNPDNLEELRRLKLASPPPPAIIPPEPMLVRLAPDSPPLPNKGST